MSEAVGSSGSRIGVGTTGTRVVGSPLAEGWSWLTIGWAAYLACSWTWCIGMFLPVLLIRDFGLWGFIAFAAPNVIGAAAMGWTLWRRGHSELLVRAHWKMVKAFSGVTIAFQVFFLLWLIRAAPQPALWAVLAAVVLMMVAGPVVAPRLKAGEKPGPLRFIRAAPLLVLSGLVWVISAGCLTAMIVRGDLTVTMPAATAAPGLAWLAPVCGFGFLLCPYLDMTFHLARQYQAAGRARASFTIGFGVLFLVMILFTALYAQVFDASRPMMVWRPIAAAGVVLLAAHIVMQLSFTTMVHGDAERRLVGSPRDAKKAGASRGLVAGIGIALVMMMLARGDGRVYAGLSWAEIGYRLFMSFYGLLFPAYVWICVIPTWREPARPTRGQRMVWLGACAVAAPMYWMGFIEREEWWLGPGLGVVLLARLLIGRVAKSAGSGGRDEPGPDELSGAPVPAPTHPPTLAAGAQAEQP